MRKAIFIVVLLLYCASFCEAQRIAAYVSSGATVSQIEGDELKGFDKWGYTGSVGAMINLSENGMWKMSLEAGYSMRGAYNNSGDPYNIKVNLSYVDVPLTAFFRDPYGGILIGVGPVYSRLVQQPHDVISYNPDYFIPDTSNMTFLKNDLALAGEIRFTIWSGLQFSVRYQRSIISIKDSWNFTEIANNRAHSWKNVGIYNSSVMARLIWQFGGLDEQRSKKHRRR